MCQIIKSPSSGHLLHPCGNCTKLVRQELCFKGLYLNPKPMPLPRNLQWLAGSQMARQCVRLRNIECQDSCLWQNWPKQNYNQLRQACQHACRSLIFGPFVFAFTNHRKVTSKHADLKGETEETNHGFHEIHGCPCAIFVVSKKSLGSNRPDSRCCPVPIR